MAEDGRVHNMSDLERITEEIFPLGDYNVRTPEEHRLAEQKGRDCIDQFGWDAVFPVWKEYLYNRCITPDDVFGFACTLFSISGYFEPFKYPMANPYEFLGYIYYRIGDALEDYVSFMDPFTVSVLGGCDGREDLKVLITSVYVPEEDPLIVAEIQKWKEKLG